MKPARKPESDLASQALQFRVELAKTDEVFAAIRQVEGVADVGLTAPRAKHPLAKSMAFARLDGSMDADLVCAKVADIPGVLDCEVSPPRYL